MRKINRLLSISILFGFMGLNAQVKIGDNHDTINPSAILELESTDRGLLLPRVALTATSNTSPLAEHKLGMIVFNTATASSGDTAVVPGLYYNSGSEWILLGSGGDANPTGTVIQKASANTPTGYLYCDGQEVSRTTYADLFADIGTTYGVGDGNNTFNLPDYRGQFLRGQDDGAGVDPDAGTRTGGDAVGSTQADELGFHNHSTNYNPAASTNLAVSTSINYVNAGNSAATGIVTTSNTGGNETRPKNIAVRYYIKY